MGVGQSLLRLAQKAEGVTSAFVAPEEKVVWNMRTIKNQLFPHGVEELKP